MSHAAPFPRLFEPIELGPIKVPNRLMLTTHGGALPAGRYLRYLEARAAGGVGLVAVSGAQAGVSHVTSVASRFIPAHAGDVDGTGPDPATRDGIAYFDEVVTPMLRDRAEAVHRHGAACVGQVFHLGSYRDADGFRPAIAPSVVIDEEDPHLPHALDESEIERLVIAFGHAVRRVRDAGMDGAEIHCAHGFLINEFLSPLSNHRRDRYGGSFENRIRFLVEILDAAAAQAPGFSIGIRINGDELVPGGLDPDAVAEIVNGLSARLVYVNISGGNASGLRDGLRLAYSSPWLTRAEHNVAAAARIKARTRLPVVVAGRILGPDQAERILERGQADLVGMVRPLIADPDLPRKSREGRLEEIRPCLGQNECHGFHGTRGHLVCAVNAAAGREEEFALDPARFGRRVVVVGGGPAGLEAARMAASRGARVVLLERQAELGGQLRQVARLPGLQHVAGYVAYQRRQLESLGVEVRLREEATADSITSLGPDVAIVATGAVPFRPKLPGLDSACVLTAVDLLDGQEVPGVRALVVGGQQNHLPPLLVALHLAESGRHVDLTTELPTAGQGVERRTLNVLLGRLAEHDVTVHPLTELAAVAEAGVLLRHHFTRRERVLEGIEMVVLACGGWPLDSLAGELRARGVTTHAVGDCQSPRRIIHAVLDGARAGSIV